MFISLLEDLLSLSTGANNNYTDRSAADHSALLASFARVQWTFPSATCTYVASSNDCIYTEFLRLEKKDLSMVEVEPCRLRVDFHQCLADTLRVEIDGLDGETIAKNAGKRSSYLQTGWRRRTEQDDEGPQMPGQNGVPPKVAVWVVVNVSGLNVVVMGLVGLDVVVVVLVGLVDVLVAVDVGASSSSLQSTKGSPVLPIPQKHSSPLSVT